MKNFFRGLVIGQVVLWLATVYVIPSSYRELQTEFGVPTSAFYLSSQFGRSLEFLFYVEVIACLSMAGFWNATRHVYTALVVIGMLLECSSRMIVRTGVRDALHVTDALLTGLILAMAYFSPLRNVFAGKQPAVASVESVPPPPPPAGYGR
jgi:hypothetical protein